MAITNLSISGNTFWKNAVPQDLFRDGPLLFVVLEDSALMHILLRTHEELFEATVQRESRSQHFIVVINGNFYDVSKSGLMDAAWGHDPVPANATTPIGRLVDNFRSIGGRLAPNNFYIANIAGPISGYEFGFGDAPTGSPYRSAIGGLGPLIINNLKYGNGNRYQPGTSAGAPTTGTPPSKYQANLIQRNNNTYIAASQLPASTGKTVIAHSSTEKKLLILVQSNGASNGITMDDLRDKLHGVGIDNAVFLDGSDPAMLFHHHSFFIRQGPNKDETNTIGIGFSIT